MMGVYEKQLRASFSEVQERIRNQLFNKSRSFKIREESHYKNESFEVIVMSVELASFFARNKSCITITIAGTKDTTWVSIIGDETNNKIKIRSGFDLEPEGIQIICDILKCYQQ